MKRHNRNMRRAIASLLIAAGAAAASPSLLASHLTREDRLSPLAAGYLERARIMLGEGNYAGVIDQLKHLDTQGARLNGTDLEDCTYLLALALYERADADCVDLLREFAEQYPASPQAMPARLAAADYFFFAHRYGSALEAYEDIDYSRINPSDRPLYDYRKALSMVKSGHYDEAATIFARLRDNRRFNLPSDYYLAYIDYINGKTDQAFREFSEVEKRLDGKHIDGIAPAYYMAQIEYSRGEYEKVIADGRRLLREQGVDELLPETKRIIGLSYFKTGNYDKATPYLTDYIFTPGLTPAADAVYALGVINYEAGDLEEAGRRFASLTDLDNDLAQSAYLYLGQIAVREGDSNAAAVSFEQASRMNYDRDVTETALFNHIAARTHGGNIPFSSSIEPLESFLRQFPTSKYAPQVQEYLATAYFNEKDYQRALESINRISRPSQRVTEAKQKILYELGVEAMSNNNPSAARRYLGECVEINADKAVKAQAWLWLGDAEYALGNYARADKCYSTFLSSEKRSANATLAKYNRAYARLLDGRYADAAASFADAMKSDPLLPGRLMDDALVRMADAQYYNGQYKLALKNYTTAIDNGSQDADYALYRRAVMYGLDGNIQLKIKELSSMPSRFPESRWLADALLEKGQTYASLGDTQNAVLAFEQLRGSYRHTAQARKGMLNLAIAYMEARQPQKAEEAYREVISKWPTSEEAMLANDDLRRYHAANGGLQEYALFLRSVPDAPQIDADEMERLSFEGAEQRYADTNGDATMLESYVAAYPNGRYLSQALLDIATSQDENGNSGAALKALDTLLERRGDAPQVPEALLLKAQILEEQGITSHKEALAAYKELERRGGSEYAADAYAGIMRTTDKDAEKMKYARLVKNSGGLSADEREEAELYEASAMLKSGDRKAAETTLRRLASNPKSLSGAKAAVALGQHYLDSGNVTDAEKTLTAFTDAGSPHEYWLARGFIALADVYHARNKDYLAVEYLKSLRDNYPGNELDIRDMIASRLKAWK